MYEKLVKELRNTERICRDRMDGEVMLKAADAIEKLANWWSMAKTLGDMVTPKWIPVTERLPEKRKWVLCWCVSDTQEVLRWENNEWYHDPMHVYFYDFVTHWMPLPMPPKEETE